MAKKILIADYSAFMRKMLIEILNEGGYTEIIEAENGKIALEKIESENPDLVLLDIIMPEVDGVEVTKQAGKKVKIIIISAIGQEGVIKEAQDNGALGFIVKPFKKEQVLEEVGKHV
ncbi:two-component system response regulator [Candidatus Parcubacteria bacterium]|nr:MAG: two-component system response regulator [Candidatus Parcubacteria bacterium]